MSKVQVFGIRNTAGHWYTGDLWGGEPVFHPDQEDAIELYADEIAAEMKSMPEGCEAAVLYEFDPPTRSQS